MNMNMNMITLAEMKERLEELKANVSNNCTGCNDCTNCNDCNDCNGCNDCYACNDCYDCNNCYACNDCLMCVGLKTKASGYWILNKEVSEVEYKRALVLISK